MSKLFIVSSVSGAGKTTLVDNALSIYDLYKLKTCTTRAIRPEETGNEYFFLSKYEYDFYLEKNAFFENAKVYGNYYGLLKSELDKSNSKNCIAILDVQGAATAKKLYPDAITIFIEPPSLDELEIRISSRNTSSDDMKLRMSKIEEELSHKSEFIYTVKYDKNENMITKFNNIIEYNL